MAHVALARATLERAARAAGHDIAVEIMWPGQAFVGVRWPAAKWLDAATAMDRVGGLFGNRSSLTTSTTAERGLLALLNAEPSPALERAVLGAVDAWRSLGPEVLWRQGEALSGQALGSILARRPDLTTCAHPVAVELVVTRPLPCWVGIYVSRHDGPVHHLDRKALDQILDRVIQADAA
jgi:hypothetical protein